LLVDTFRGCKEIRAKGKFSPIGGRLRRPAIARSSQGGGLKKKSSRGGSRFHGRSIIKTRRKKRLCRIQETPFATYLYVNYRRKGQSTVIESGVRVRGKRIPGGEEATKQRGGKKRSKKMGKNFHSQQRKKKGFSKRKKFICKKGAKMLGMRVS